MTIRKNVTMSKSTAEWFENKSKEMGVPQSSLMAIALSDYIKQENALKTLDELMMRLNIKDTFPKLTREWTEEDKENWNEQIANAYPEKYKKKDKEI